MTVRNDWTRKDIAALFDLLSHQRVYQAATVHCAHHPVAGSTMPMSMVRLSAGRESMSEATQALCFMAGANSIFTGDKLLTAANAGDDKDAAMLAKLGLVPMEAEEPLRACKVLEAAE